MKGSFLNIKYILPCYKAIVATEEIVNFLAIK